MQQKKSVPNAEHLFFTALIELSAASQIMKEKIC